MVKWTGNEIGIHIVQMFPLDYLPGIALPEKISRIIGKLENPIMAIISLVSNPSRRYSHMIENSSIREPDRIMHILNNALRKYAQTEQIIIEGGQNIVLFSSKEF